MNRIHFFVPGNPIALKRHRTVRMGNFNRQYDPSEGDKKDFLVKCLNYRPSKPFDGPLELELWFRFKRPKNHYRTGKFSNQLKENVPYWHIKKPDRDNLEKFVLDALNGIFWKDDSIICSGNVHKVYDDDSPGIYISITPLKDNS